MVYNMTIAGVNRDLPICKVSDDLYIGAFVIFGDVELTVASAKALLEKAGFTSKVLTPKPDYERNMQDWNDPLYKQIAETLPQGEEMADYVVSLSIEARK